MLLAIGSAGSALLLTIGPGVLVRHVRAFDMKIEYTREITVQSPNGGRWELPKRPQGAQVKVAPFMMMCGETRGCDPGIPVPVSMDVANADVAVDGITGPLKGTTPDGRQHYYRVVYTAKGASLSGTTARIRTVLEIAVLITATFATLLSTWLRIRVHRRYPGSPRLHLMFLAGLATLLLPRDEQNRYTYEWIAELAAIGRTHSRLGFALGLPVAAGRVRLVVLGLIAKGAAGQIVAVLSFIRIVMISRFSRLLRG